MTARVKICRTFPYPRHMHNGSFDLALLLSSIKTAFTRCRYVLKTLKNMTDRPFVHTRMAIFCRQIWKW